MEQGSIIEQPRLNFIIYLRALAVSTVTLIHYYFFAVSQVSSLSAPSLVSLSEYGAGFGVYLFFLISGFCITLTLEKNVDIKSFFIHRLFRIYPIFILSAIIYQLSYFLPISGEVFSNKGEFFGVEMMLKQLFFLEVTNVPYGVTWTISYEMAFYLFFGLMFFILKGIKFKFVLIYSILTYFLMHYYDVTPSSKGMSGYWGSPLHVIFTINFMMLGVLFAMHYLNKLSLRSLGFYIAWIVLTLRADIEPFSIARVLLPLLVFAISYFNRDISFFNNNKFFSKIIKLVGNISYPLYLLHSLGYNLIFVAYHIWKINYIFINLVALLLCIGFSYVLHVYLEKPLIRYSKRL